MLNKVWLYLDTELQTSSFPSLHNSSVSFHTLYVYHVKLRNRFSLLDSNQQSTGFLKHVENIVKPLVWETKSQKRKILYLEVAKWGKVDPRSKNTWALNMKSLKSNSPLANVIEDLGNLGNKLTKQDHIIIVGGPENSLGRSYHHSIEKHTNFIAERANNTNVGFVNLFCRHDNLCINRKVRIVNLIAWSGSTGAWQVSHWRYLSHIISQARLH